MSEDAGKKSCASYTAECRLILVGGLRRDDADPLASSRRETEEIRRGVPFTVCTQKKGFGATTAPTRTMTTSPEMVA